MADELTFDDLCQVLEGWLGKRVRVTVSGPEGWMVGVEGLFSPEALDREVGYVLFNLGNDHNYFHIRRPEVGDAVVATRHSHGLVIKTEHTNLSIVDLD